VIGSLHDEWIAKVAADRVERKLEVGQVYTRGSEVIVLLEDFYKSSHDTHEWTVAVLAGWNHVPLPFKTVFTEHTLRERWARLA
jgi:hypothetical protein